MGSFQSDFAERLGLETESVDGVLEVLAEYVWGQVDDEGRCDIPGLGSFFVVDGKRIFEPSSELSRVVNHRYAGLSALAVEGSKSEILIPDAYDDDETVDAPFQPVWQDLPETSDEVGDVKDIAPDFTEERFTDATPSRGKADSESLISSFLGLDTSETPAEPEVVDFAGNGAESEAEIKSADDVVHDDAQDSSTDSSDTAKTTDISDESATETIKDLDDVGTDIPEPESSTDSQPPVESAEVDAEVKSAGPPADTEKVSVVVPVDENAEPVVAKGKPRRSPWVYALPLVALAFAVLAVIWAQTRSTTPRPTPQSVEQDAAIAETDDNTTETSGVDDATDDPASEATITDDQATPPVVTDTGQVLDPNSSDPGERWGRGEINLSEGGFTIVVSSNPTLSEAVSVARDFARELDNTPVPVDILETHVDGQTRYRVAVGQYRRSEVAQRDIDFLGDRLPSGSWTLRLPDNL